MKEIGGNFIDFDTEDEEGRCSFGRGLRPLQRRYPKLRRRRARIRIQSQSNRLDING